FTRALSRFRDIARHDGLAAASIRAARKIQKKLSTDRLFPSSWFASDRCHYYSPPPKSEPYDAWVRVNRDNPRRRRRIETALSPPGPQPRFSILVPVYNPPVDVFRAMIESVVKQTFSGWELILVDDASPDPRVRQEMGAWSSRDGRIRAILRQENGNISVATN